MGAEEFFVKSAGKNARDAFNTAVEDAQYEYGHGGYTGTIAEKHGFVMVTVPSGHNIEDYAYKLVDEGAHQVSDKWGPAGCIDLDNGSYMFFGLASS